MEGREDWRRGGGGFSPSLASPVIPVPVGALVLTPLHLYVVG